MAVSSATQVSGMEIIDESRVISSMMSGYSEVKKVDPEGLKKIALSPSTQCYEDIQVADKVEEQLPIFEEPLKVYA